MKVVDANVLLYVLNRDSAHHKALLDWWETAINGVDPIGLCWNVLLAVMRISTHPSIFPKPLSAEQALETVGKWLSHPNVRMVVESEGHWLILKSLLGEIGTAGNLTSDAHLASMAIGNGAVLVSCDSDFSRFRQLRWENPLVN